MDPLALEYNRNRFSRFYDVVPNEDDMPNRRIDSDIQRELRNYTHDDAVKFAAESWSWQFNDMPPLPRSLSEVPTFKKQEGLRAYYRVLTDEPNRYILIACHVNVHGFHRGDLRFVEVTDKTIVRGLNNESIIGKLYPGDLVAVTKLSRKSKVPSTLNPLPVRNIHRQTDCIWQVHKMTVLTRKRADKKVNFMILENGTAIVEGMTEAFNVIKDPFDQPEQDKIYIGDAFIPEKIEYNFIENCIRRYKLQLTALVSKLYTYPDPLGTIYSYSFCPHQTRLFEIGVNAFKSETFLSRAKEADDVVEKCVRMGSSAAVTVSRGRFDGRAFPMKNIRRDGLILHFSIANPSVQPTEGRWNTNNRISIVGNNFKTEAIIETTVLGKHGINIQIAARLPTDTSDFDGFSQGVWIVHQSPSLDCFKLEPGFFKNLHANSNGRRVIETLYGGPVIDTRERIDDEAVYMFPSEPLVVLNEYQSLYVSMMIADVPLVLGNSPFGCGKSMTIVTAAVEVHKQNSRHNNNGKQRQQLLITQTNNASVSLIDIATKVTGIEIKFLRYVSESNWKFLPDSSRSGFDMPTLQKKLFVGWAENSLEDMREFRQLRSNLKDAIVKRVTQEYMSPELLQGEAKRIYENMNDYQRKSIPSPRDLREAFFIVYQPDVIVSTADSLHPLLKANLLKYIGQVQIDEASQLPEHTLIYLLKEFHNAGFGLVGDTKQLPPHCEREIVGRLKDYGIGNTMERSTNLALFPQSVLRYVYRCHPVTTLLLSDLFYDSRLIYGVEENERNEFMRMRQDIWPNERFPILVLNHEEEGYRMGTSVANNSERNHVFRIVKCLTQRINGYQLEESNIGIISFYRAQASILIEAFRGTEVKCGTVDAFQGTEREVMIVCCTNEKLSEFMKLGNRLNVAMSRSRQVTLIVGNVSQLRCSKYWRTIVRQAEDNDCIVDEISQFGSGFHFDQGNIGEIESSSDSNSSSDEDDDPPDIQPKPENQRRRGRRGGRGRRRKNKESNKENIDLDQPVMAEENITRRKSRPNARKREQIRRQKQEKMIAEESEKQLSQRQLTNNQNIKGLIDLSAFNNLSVSISRVAAS